LAGPLSVLVVLDVDSTLIQQEVIELLADFAGVMPEVAQITDRAMSGELDFEQSLRQRVLLLAGLSADHLSSVQAQVQLTPGVTELIQTVHEIGGKVGVVSGGFSQILDPLATSLGLDYWSANTLEQIDGKLTGEVIGEVIDAKAKALALKKWSLESGIPLKQTIAVGDGANDVEMLQAAGFAVGFRPKPILREYADLVIEKNSLIELVEVVKLRAS
jgi:phosphoserine phosphatase